MAAIVDPDRVYTPREGPFHLPDLSRPLGRQAVRIAEQLLKIDKLNDIYLAAHDPDSEVIGFSQRVLDHLGVHIDVPADFADALPTDKPLIVVANHPFGGAEGLVLATLLLRIRPDIRMLANYLLGLAPELRELFYLVDPFDRPGAVQRNVSSLKAAVRWVRDGHCLGVFPAGEVSHATWKRRSVSDPEWSSTVGRLARMTGAAVVPIFFEGNNSLLFQLLGLVHPRLRTAALPREFCKMRDQTIHATIGDVIEPDRISQFDSDVEATAYMRVRTYLLRQKLDAERTAAQRYTPDPHGSVGHELVRAVTPDELRAEIEGLSAEQILDSSSKYDVIYARASQIPQTLHQIGRLREIAFRAVGEGTGRAIDLADYDEWYLHLFVWNRESHEVVGGYRLGPTDEIFANHGVDGLYTTSLFDLDAQLVEQLNPALELGRSFVCPEYQRQHAPLMLLWRGIGKFVAKYPKYHQLFGPVSISDQYHTMSKQLLVAFLETNRLLDRLSRWIRPRHRVKLPRPRDWSNEETNLVVRDLEEVDEIIRDLEGDRLRVPVLLRQYLKLNARVLGFNVDHKFGGVIDGLMLVDLRDVDLRVLGHYMGKEEATAFMAHHSE